MNFCRIEDFKHLVLAIMLSAPVVSFAQYGGRIVVGTVDTPEVVDEMVRKTAKMIDDAMLPSGWRFVEEARERGFDCRETLESNYGNKRQQAPNGWDEAASKCNARLKPKLDAFNAYADQLAKDVADDQKEKQRAEDEKERNSERARLKLIDDLQTGKVQPEDCRQFATSKKLGNSLNSNVMAAALEAPKGMGQFYGRLEQIEGKVLGISSRVPNIMGTAALLPRFTVIRLDDSTAVFNGGNIRVGSIINGFGTQVDSKVLTFQDGSKFQAAVIKAACINP